MFQINGEWWKVLLTSAIHPKLLRSNGSLAFGSCDNESKSIYINENLSPGLMKRVLCHEITHAAMFSYDIEINSYQEELLADLIATYGQEIIDITNRIFVRMVE